MEINLRRASELDQRISRRLGDLRLRLSPDYTVPIFRTTADFHKQLRQDMLDLLAKIDRLEEIRYEVRDMVATANVSAGISRRVTEMTRLKEKLHRLAELSSKDPAPSEADLTLELESRRARFEGVEDSYSATSQDSFRVHLFNQADIDGFEDAMRDIDRRLIELSNELAEINGKSKIALDDAFANDLKEEGLI